MTNFDKIMNNYIIIKSNSVLTKYCQLFSFIKSIGDVQGKSVLDLACGDGYYTRLLKQRKAVQVVGVDISKRMIDQAKQVEAEMPLGITYRAQDVTTLGKIGNFDLVTAVQLFPSIPTRKSLKKLLQTIYDNLKHGGKFVSVTPNPNLSEQDLTAYEQYGISLVAEAGLQDGARITTIFSASGASVQFRDFHWTLETFNTILQQVGFQRIVWHPMQVSEAGIKELGADYWQAFLTKPRSVVLECHK